MTIASTTTRVSYTTDGVTTAFPVPIQAYGAADFVVWLTSATGVETGLTLGSAYTMATSGTLTPTQWTLNTIGTPLAAGQTLQIILSPVETQNTVYTQGQAFPASAIQANVDRLTQMVLRAQDQLNRAFVAPDGDVNPAVALPAAINRANLAPVFGPTGNLQMGMIPTTALTQAIFNSFLAAAPIYLQTTAETTAGLTATNLQIPSPDIAGLAFTARYMTAAQRSNTTECSALLNAIAAMCTTNVWTLWCAPSDRFKTSATITFTFPAQVRMNGARIVPFTSGFAGTSAVLIVGDNESSAGGYQSGFVMDIAAQGPNGGEGNSVPVQNAIATFNTLDGIVINPSSAQQITDCDLHLWVEGFRDNIVVSGTNFYIFRWQQPHCTKAWRNGWNISETGGAGENLAIFGGLTANCTNGGSAGGAAPGTANGFTVSGANAVIEIDLYSHSLDYNDTMMAASGGVFKIFGGHSENGKASGSGSTGQAVNSNPMYVMSSTGGQPPTELHFFAHILGQTEPAPGRPALVSSTGAVAVTYEGRKLYLYGVQATALLNVISGNPAQISVNCFADTSGGSLQGQMPTICPTLLNKVYNGVNPAASTFAGWTQNGVTNITWSNTGTAAQAVVTAATSGSYSQNAIPVSPGEVYLIQAAVNVTAVSAGYASTNYQFLDAKGDVVVSQGTFNQVSTVSNTYSGGEIQVPAGATALAVVLNFTGFTGTVQYSKVIAEKIGR